MWDAEEISGEFSSTIKRCWGRKFGRIPFFHLLHYGEVSWQREVWQVSTPSGAVWRLFVAVLSISGLGEPCLGVVEKEGCGVVGYSRSTGMSWALLLCIWSRMFIRSLVLLHQRWNEHHSCILKRKWRLWTISAAETVTPWYWKAWVYLLVQPVAVSTSLFRRSAELGVFIGSLILSSHTSEFAASCFLLVPQGRWFSPCSMANVCPVCWLDRGGWGGFLLAGSTLKRIALCSEQDSNSVLLTDLMTLMLWICCPSFWGWDMTVVRAQSVQCIMRFAQQCSRHSFVCLRLFGNVHCHG